jgi:uridine kinase
VDADFSVTLRRAMERDRRLFGSADVIEERYLHRYIPGQKLYFADAAPREHADVVVKNDDQIRPILIGSPRR